MRPLIPPAQTNNTLSSSSLSSFDYAALSLVLSILLLSFFSLLLVLSLRRRPSLSPFVPLSPLRLTLVSLVSLWALHQALRFGLFTPTDAFCRLHTVVSLGVLEPAFLLAVLSLLRLSVSKPREVILELWSITVPIVPTLALQIFFVVIFPSQGYFRNFSLPSAFFLSSERTEDGWVRCTCPLLGTFMFAAFFMFYCVAFLVTYWRVINLVINKGTRVRIHVLTLSLFVCVCLQLLLMTVSTFWRLDDVAYGFMEVGLFMVPAVCAMFGEGILVIKPIMDALGADNCRH